jgi:hypothetical protein
LKPHHGALRIGRLARWQRWTSYAVLASCAATGVVWFALMDLAEWQPTKLVLWWVAHGATGFLAIMAIGMALPHHIVSTWRHHRNRWLGSIALGTLAALAVTALLLLYGKEAWHVGAHWTHVVFGLAALAAFPLHVLRGKRSLAKSIR